MVLPFDTSLCNVLDFSYNKIKKKVFNNSFIVLTFFVFIIIICNIIH